MSDTTLSLRLRLLGIQWTNLADLQRRTLAEMSAYAGDLEKEVARLEALIYVPGLTKCTKCVFRLVSKTLYMGNGTVGANNKLEDCPNGHGPMVRVTERELREEQFDQMLGMRNDTLELAAGMCEQEAELCLAGSPAAANSWPFAFQTMATKIRDRKVEP